MPRNTSSTADQPLGSAAWGGGSVEASFAKSALGKRLIALQHEGTSSNRAIADYLLRNPARIPAWGIEELAAHTQVSAATLSRFARTVGFESYSELRAAAAEALQTMLQPVEKLANSIDEADAGSALTPWQRSLEASLSNVRKAGGGLDAATTQKLVDLLAQAREVYTMGFGLSAHLAAILALHLQPFCKRCTNVVEYGGTEVAAGTLMEIERSDVLVVISLPRYSSDVLRLCNYARSRHATIVAITDSPASPLAQIATHTLLAPATHPVLSSSLGASLALVEALAAALMVSNRNNVKQAAKLTDAISNFLVMNADELRTGR
jgi:DNA-binding MurR/RpiR family transcriptional regulator